jgi:hypothetical protein
MIRYQCLNCGMEIKTKEPIKRCLMCEMPGLELLFPGGPPCERCSHPAHLPGTCLMEVGSFEDDFGPLPARCWCGVSFY